MMNKGDLLEFYTSGKAENPGDFEIVDSKPIAVMNDMTGA